MLISRMGENADRETADPGFNRDTPRTAAHGGELDNINRFLGAYARKPAQTFNFENVPPYTSPAAEVLRGIFFNTFASGDSHG